MFAGGRSVSLRNGKFGSGAGVERLLITFCNTLPQGFGLAAYDFDTTELEWIDLPSFVGTVGGAHGVCRGEDGYYAVLQHREPGWPSSLAAYDLDLQLRFATRLKHVRDGHSIIWSDGVLLVASTGTNELVRIHIDADNRVKEEVLWSLGSAGSDQDHLNSLAAIDGRLFVSCFGDMNGQTDQLNRNGRIFEVGSATDVQSQLRQPHSLTWIDGSLYCVESVLGRVWRFREENSAFVSEVLFEVSGYVRGFTASQRYFYIGASAQRLRSKSRGRLNPHPHNLNDLHCLVYRVDRETGNMETRDLTAFGREIFDIVVLQPGSQRAAPGSSAKSLITRQLAYDQEHLKALEDLRLALEALESERKSRTTASPATT
jgi:Domain of unknown function (DUF4915)